MLFLEYPKCSTCKKAKKWLDEQGISYEDRHIIEDNPTAEELKDWHLLYANHFLYLSMNSISRYHI